mmetsp:Transcript_73909/g.186921  ORF Transcript_73909/g.186921 Transcript_73909/m.186921 type:complete len:172 (-) Transcript_73909:113-628(-)
MAAAAQEKSKGGEAKKGGKEPFAQQSELKDVFYLFADRKTKLLPLNDVTYVLRACGLIIYGDEEAEIKAQVEKIDGLGKPVSFQTLQDWMVENQSTYTRPFDDAYGAFWSLCKEELIGDKSGAIKLPYLRHLVSEVGDKIKPETFDKILKGDDSIKGDTIALDDFVAFLQK